ncbi:MAG: hypothetical protein DCC68_26430 [Planctomycetota bacterium]|nr:MAG: hypothetical protein DCC68_26430 [Planctomycetota bacterium]
MYYMPKRNMKMPMTDALKAAIAESGLPYLRLEQETGVLRQSLMKFMAGETSLRLDIADKLAVYFGLEVTKRKGK